MPTAAEAIAAWKVAGDLVATLYICDNAATLPPPPAGLTSLDCRGCPKLASLPALPVGLTVLLGLRKASLLARSARWLDGPAGAAQS